MSATGVSIELNVAQQIRDLELPLTDAKVKRAVKRALKKTMKYLERQISKAVSKETGLPQKAMKDRYKVSLFADKFVATLWIGLNPVDASKAGRASQSKIGVRVAGTLFEGAFHKRVFGEEPKIWRRVFRGKGSSKRGRKDGRFPVERMTFEIEDPVEIIVQAIQSRAEARFETVLAQELNYEINVR